MNKLLEILKETNIKKGIFISMISDLEPISVSYLNETLFLTDNEITTLWGGGSGAAIYSSTALNLPNGAIFEESDTGKHYMFDGTDTWNEMT